MSSEPAPQARKILVRWMKATFYGWMLGFVLVIALVMAFDFIGGGAQFMVGVGMGAGVGFLQSREMRPWMERPRSWLWASTLGLGAPFVCWDIGSATGVGFLFSQVACVVIGGLLVATMQWRLLRSVSDRAFLWLPACFAGWSLPALAMGVNDLKIIPEPFGVALLLAGMFGGGFMLGGVTGPVLARLVRSPAGTQEPAALEG